MQTKPIHRCRVHGTPWSGVYGTHAESARHYGKHFHGTFGFGVLERGAQRSASGRGQVEALAGDVITTNPGEVHDGRPLGAPSRRWRIVYLAPAVAQSLAGSREFEFAHPVIRDPALARGLRQLFARLDEWRGRAIEALACEESLASAFALLACHTIGKSIPETSAELRRVRDRLGDQLADPPSLEALAQMTGLSRYQLLRRFEQAYGLPPHAWVLQQRIERARSLIGKGAGLASAAAASGFADQSHMTRAFTRRDGFTPGAWRRASAED